MMPGFGDYLARLLTGAAGRSAEEAAPALTARVYRGAPGPEQWPPTSQVNDTFWASDNPAVADTYAANFGDLSGKRTSRLPRSGSKIHSSWIGGREWDNLPFDGKRYTSDAFASLARRRGYDGLVLRNVQDDGPLATSYAAVKPGTVFSPLTGERLYAGAPIAAGAAAGAAGLAGSPSQSEAATMPDNDQIVATMLGNQPAQPQPLTFDDHMERIRQFWAGQQPAVSGQAPSPQLQPQDDGAVARVLAPIHAFWAGQGQPSQLNDNPRGFGDVRPEQRTVMQKDPGAFQGELRSTYRPGEYLEPAEQGAADVMANTGLGLPAIPGINALGRVLTNPKVLAGAAGAAGMLGMMPEASTAGDSPVSRLNEQIAVLQKQQADALRRKMENQDNPGSKFRQAQKDYDDATTGIKSAQHQLDQYANSPEHQQDIAQRAKDLAAAQADKEARTPFRERHPDIAATLPAAGYIASLGLPAIAGAKNKLGSFLPGSYAGRIRAGIDAFDDATRSGANADVPRAVLKNLLDQEPGPVKAGWKALSAAGAGGGLAAEAGVYPDLADAYGSMPEGPEKDAARARLADLPPHLVRIGAGTFTGLSGYKAGQIFSPERPAVIAEARGRINPLGAGAYAPEGAAATGSGWGPEHPNYRPRGDDGRFQSR